MLRCAAFPPTLMYKLPKMEYLRQHLVVPNILGESIWQRKWALYALSLFLSLLIPTIGPSNCAMQRFFDESQQSPAP